MLNFSVRSDRCGGCGLCVKDCLRSIIALDNNKLPFVAPQNEEKCQQCQHCLAVCPKAAISIFGLDPDDSMPVSTDHLPQLQEMTRLVRGRRSVRQYRNQNVDPQMIRQLLATIANAPTGRNNRSLTFTVIDDRETLSWFRTQTMQSLQNTVKAGHLPENLAFLQDDVSNYFANKGDGIFRGAPHLLIVSALPDAPCPVEDVTIALAYFELLAQSAGLGTVWCGLLKWILDLIPELKSLVGLPQGHHFYAMLFGYPAIRYARTVQRDDAATIKQVNISGSA
jgi:nitroreductase/NAD-dependent dihydropyrimidine dehydrogenase PreA subunit